MRTLCVAHGEKSSEYYRMEDYFEKLLSSPKADLPKVIAKLLSTMVDKQVITVGAAADIAGKPDSDYIIDDDYTNW